MGSSKRCIPQYFLSIMSNAMLVHPYDAMHGASLYKQGDAHWLHRLRGFAKASQSRAQFVATTSLRRTKDNSLEQVIDEPWASR